MLFTNSNLKSIFINDVPYDAVEGVFDIPEDYLDTLLAHGFEPLQPEINPEIIETADVTNKRRKR